MSKDLFKEAIADAKAVREAALANAKLALEEAFTPHIKEMLAAKIEEMDNQYDEMEEAKMTDDMEEGKGMETEAEVNEDYYEDGSVQEELSLEEILAALEEAEKAESVNEESELEEAKKKKASKEEEKEDLDEVIDLEALLAEAEEEEAEEEEAEEEEEEETEEASEEDEEVGEMTVEELKDLIRSVVGEMGGGAETKMPASEEPEMVNLDEILAELGENVDNDIRPYDVMLNVVKGYEGLEDYVGSFMKNFPKGKPITKDAWLSWHRTIDGGYDPEGYSEEYWNNPSQLEEAEVEKLDEYITSATPLEAALGVLATLVFLGGTAKAAGFSLGDFAKAAALSSVDKIKEFVKKKSPELGDKLEAKLENKTSKTESISETSDETLAEIEALRTELNETNLLNAKLLYSNKIFRANELNENQKLRVINAFDKASNVNEAKLIYETIKDSFTTAKEKKQIKESLGFASKPTGASKSRIIDQPDNTVARLQKLAGII